MCTKPLVATAGAATGVVIFRFDRLTAEAAILAKERFMAGGLLVLYKMT